MRGLPTFLISIILFTVALPTQPTTLVAFAVSMTLAAFMSAAITIAIFSSAFWTLDTTGISGLSYSIITLFSGMLVPIALWPEWLAHIAAWLPFGGLIDIPFSIYLGKITGMEALGGYRQTDDMGRLFRWVRAPAFKTWIFSARYPRRLVGISETCTTFRFICILLSCVSDHRWRIGYRLSLIYLRKRAFLLSIFS